MTNTRTAQAARSLHGAEVAHFGQTLREQIVQVWVQALFCSPLRSSDHPDPETVCQAVAEQLTACAGLPGGCAGLFAREAGDYPVGFPERMAWCRRAVDRAYTVLLSTPCARLKP